jgi:hypothetical protein
MVLKTVEGRPAIVLESDFDMGDMVGALDLLLQQHIKHCGIVGPAMEDLKELITKLENYR